MYVRVSISKQKWLYMKLNFYQIKYKIFRVSKVDYVNIKKLLCKKFHNTIFKTQSCEENVIK